MNLTVVVLVLVLLQQLVVLVVLLVLGSIQAARTDIAYYLLITKLIPFHHN